jgi:hypothetical protein
MYVPKSSNILYFVLLEYDNLLLIPAETSIFWSWRSSVSIVVMLQAGQLGSLDLIPGRCRDFIFIMQCLSQIELLAVFKM